MLLPCAIHLTHQQLEGLQNQGEEGKGREDSCFYPDDDLYDPVHTWNYQDIEKWPSTCLQETSKEGDLTGKEKSELEEEREEGEAITKQGNGKGEEEEEERGNLQSPVNLPRRGLYVRDDIQIYTV